MMNKVIATYKNGSKETFRAVGRVDHITVSMLPDSFRRRYDLDEETDAETLVHEHLKVTLEHEPIDGRTSEAKSLKWYSVGHIFSGTLYDD